MFDEVALLTGVAFSESGRSVAGMGVDFRDVDNDGMPDIFETAMWGDSFPLFRNAGRFFEDLGVRSNVAALSSRMTAWGNGIFDFDNDGLKDLFMGGSAILDNSEEIDRLPYLLPARVFRNLGPNGFADVSVAAGEALVSPRDACRRGLPQGLGRCGTSA
jgi:hypothetical protein